MGIYSNICGGVVQDNVVGPRCDTCAPGHFHLDARNPMGCTPCYCNGATTVCEAAKLAVYTVLERADWHVTDLLRRRVVAAVHEQTDVRIAHDEMSRFYSYYWLAPQQYLGSRMTSYGQTLKVKVAWVKLRGDTSGQPTRCPDVIIEGAGYRIAYGDNTYKRGKSVTLEIPLYEHGWFHFPKPGYRRVNNTIFGGECRKCDCNGHVDSCDPYTGACGECQHNTVGPRCERCAAGFFGDPSLGTPDACQACECPLPLGSNHFTPRCVPDLDLGGYKCKCPAGYVGPKCERCAEGYFGNPFLPGNYCRPCECNGNLDLREKGTCDSQTGQCLKCTGNTAGWHCERCKENYYGDASRGQCHPCGCHERGSLSTSCDPQTGQCKCRNLFTGRQCDRCKRGHGGVAEGCPRCNCDPEGSTSQICDPFTGQCPCKPDRSIKSYVDGGKDSLDVLLCAKVK
ncbi:Laminin subunit alpha-2 [Portunus trituberculatus]|uniref:Laminin subunit alpha-2 n=1 Tax=Portunus trituberculatus TaxID=210409 RepID=A0A5B7F0D6_PORTR|nr:Laminin subunit alpha-2 [Portunus trituberculatus]